MEIPLEATTIGIPIGSLVLVLIAYVRQVVYINKELEKRVPWIDFNKEVDKLQTIKLCDERSGNIENKLNTIEQDVKEILRNTKK